MPPVQTRHWSAPRHPYLGCRRVAAVSHSEANRLMTSAIPSPPMGLTSTTSSLLATSLSVYEGRDMEEVDCLLGPVVDSVAAVDTYTDTSTEQTPTKELAEEMVARLVALEQTLRHTRRLVEYDFKALEARWGIVAQHCQAATRQLPKIGQGSSWSSRLPQLTPHQSRAVPKSHRSETTSNTPVKEGMAATKRGKSTKSNRSESRQTCNTTRVLTTRSGVIDDRDNRELLRKLINHRALLEMHDEKFRPLRVLTAQHPTVAVLVMQADGTRELISKTIRLEEELLGYE